MLTEYLQRQSGAWASCAGRVSGYDDGADEGTALSPPPRPVCHTPNVSKTPLQALYASILTYNLAINVVKMSFLLQYRRIFGMGSFAADRICHWLFILIAVWAVAQAILLSISCIPVAAIIPANVLTLCPCGIFRLIRYNLKLLKSMWKRGSR